MRDKTAPIAVPLDEAFTQDEFCRNYSPGILSVDSEQLCDGLSEVYDQLVTILQRNSIEAQDGLSYCKLSDIHRSLECAVGIKFNTIKTIAAAECNPEKPITVVSAALDYLHKFEGDCEMFYRELKNKASPKDKGACNQWCDAMQERRKQTMCNILDRLAILNPCAAFEYKIWACNIERRKLD